MHCDWTLYINVPTCRSVCKWVKAKFSSPSTVTEMLGGLLVPRHSKRMILASWMLTGKAKRGTNKLKDISKHFIETITFEQRSRWVEPLYKVFKAGQDSAVGNTRKNIFPVKWNLLRPVTLLTFQAGFVPAPCIKEMTFTCLVFVIVAVWFRHWVLTCLSILMNPAFIMLRVIVKLLLVFSVLLASSFQVV